MKWLTSCWLKRTRICFVFESPCLNLVELAVATCWRIWKWLWEIKVTRNVTILENSSQNLLILWAPADWYLLLLPRKRSSGYLYTVDWGILVVSYNGGFNNTSSQHWIMNEEKILKYSKAREEIISIWYWAGTQLEIQTWPSFWWCLLRKSPDKKSEVCWGVINHFINLDIHNMHYKSGSSTSGDHTTMQTVQPFWSFWQRTLGLLFF